MISKLLVVNPSERITFTEAKKHKFFEEINFDDLMKCEMKAPFKPIVMSDIDTRNFIPCFDSKSECFSVGSTNDKLF